jgi:hypothetical protein
VNVHFSDALAQIIKETPDKIQELSLARSKNISKIISSICGNLKDNIYLAYLDLSNNNLDAIPCKAIANLIRVT